MDVSPHLSHFPASMDINHSILMWFSEHLCVQCTAKAEIHSGPGPYSLWSGYCKFTQAVYNTLLLPKEMVFLREIVLGHN